MKRRPKYGSSNTVDTSSTALQIKEEVAAKAPERRLSWASKASAETVTNSDRFETKTSTISRQTSADAKMPRKEEEQALSSENIGQLLSMQLRGAATIAPGDRKEQHREANPTCPFSHDSLDSSESISLRCGHRFSLSQLEIARRGPIICASAGFASKDALICPLCGDQDITTTPEGKKILTTYSTNTAAYLGDLRKDCQWNLLPSQDTPRTLPQDTAEQHRRGQSFLPTILSACKA
jgi:hypothetical protein